MRVTLLSNEGFSVCNLPKMSYISRNSPVAQKIEQLERNREKHLKVHATGYNCFSTGFELKSVFKVMEVIKGQNSFLGENIFFVNKRSNKHRTIILTLM